jgi:hypothetical protein
VVVDINDHASNVEENQLGSFGHRRSVMHGQGSRQNTICFLTSQKGNF